MAPFESDQDLTNVPSFIELIQSTQAHTKCLDISLTGGLLEPVFYQSPWQAVV